MIFPAQNALKFALGLVLLIASLESTLLSQNKGAITFSDTAPPPTEQQKQEAQRLFGVAQGARDHLDRVAKAIRATAELQRSLVLRRKNPGKGASISKSLETWSSGASGIAVVSGSTVSIDDKRIVSYPKLTLDAADAVSKVKGLLRPTEIDTSKKLADSLQDSFFTFYDLTLLQHGAANIVLRTYPYFSLVGQPFIECDVLNTYSRDVKCFPPKTQGTQTNSSWLASKSVNLSDFCRTDKIEPFSRDEYGNQLIYVRKRSVAASQVQLTCPD